MGNLYDVLIDGIENNKLRVLSLFSGIGAFEKALTNLDIDYKLVNYCEINEHASKCYSLIHNVSEDLNLVDITTVDTSKLDDFDLLTHGSPCQSFSSAGKQEGGVKGSGTQSSLLWETIRIIQDKKPRFVIWENVKNVLSQKHLPVFNEYLKELETLGYKNYIPPKGVLNSKDFGIPQSRERLFVVSILGEHEPYEFPKGFRLETDLSDFIDFRDIDDITYNFHRRYNEKYGEITLEEFENYIENLPVTRGIGTKKMKLYDFNEMDTITTSTGLTGTLTCRNVQNFNKKFWYNKKLYKPSPKMCWKLMGFTDDDFDKVKHIGNDSDLWNRAGNSIVVNVVEAIFKNLFQNN